MIHEIDVKTKKTKTRKWTKKEEKTHNEIAAQSGDEKSYAEQRLESYPRVGDQLDAIWKELNYRQTKGERLQTEEARNMLGVILQIKEDYPKPKKK